MLPSAQPRRPQPPQQPARTTYAHQQTRAVHATPLSTPSQNNTNTPASPKPRNQIEAMPPFTPSALVPPRNLYDSAVRHPVFFTEQLRRAPFPLPPAATQGWNPVASGYILEQRRVEGNGIPRTKL